MMIRNGIHHCAFIMAQAKVGQRDALACRQRKMGEGAATCIHAFRHTGHSEGYAHISIPKSGA